LTLDHQSAPTRAVSRRGRHEGRPARRYTRLPRQALARRSALLGTPGAAPPFLSPLPFPGRHVPRAPWPGRTDRAGHPTASPSYRAHARRHTEPPSRGRIGTCSPRRTRLYKGQELAGHVRGAVAQSRAASPLPSTPSSCAHSVSQPSAPLGSFARTQWSSPSHTLPGANRRLAGAKPPVASAARSRRESSSVTFPPQNSTQASPSRPLAPSQTLPQLRPPARLPDFGQPRGPLVPGTALQSHKKFQGCLCKSGVYLWTSNSLQGPVRVLHLTILCVSAATCKID
jgi:hypothetical protein